MKIEELLFLLQWGTLSAAISLLFFKYWYIVMVAKNKPEQAKSKWLGWYQYQELRQMNSPQLWEIMQQNNRITTAMWVCGAVSLSLFLVNAFN
jgi:hypothetical protein